jgi:hypothetical protein
VQQRLEVIQRLMAVQGTSEYGTVQRQAAGSLVLSQEFLMTNDQNHSHYFKQQFQRSIQ